MQLNLADVLAGLSHALDMTQGHESGHVERSCLLGMRLAERAGMPEDERADLYYALLLKDAGCSVNAAEVAELYGGDDTAAKQAFRGADLTRPIGALRHMLQAAAPGEPLPRRLGRMRAIIANSGEGSARLTALRCDRGAQIVRALGLSDESAAAVGLIDAHWDGGGHPQGLAGDDIPLSARVIGLAQVIELYWSQGGPAAACAVALKRRGRWFDPALADLVSAARHDPSFWEGLTEHPDLSTVAPRGTDIPADPQQLDVIADAFGQIVDAKSPFTAHHSQGVAELAARTARQLGLPEPEVRRLHRAGELHDLGKLGISNRILDKPGRLTDEEWTAIRAHPQAGHDVLIRIPALADMARLALTHHERLDGSGYPHGLRGDELDLADRILAVADVAEALSADRPYRGSLTTAAVLEIMRADAPAKLDAGVVDALAVVLPEWRGETPVSQRAAA